MLVSSQWASCGGCGGNTTPHLAVDLLGVGCLALSCASFAAQVEEACSWLGPAGGRRRGYLAGRLELDLNGTAAASGVTQVVLWSDYRSTLWHGWSAHPDG